VPLKVGRVASTVHAVEATPRFVSDRTFEPFINQISTAPLVLRHRMSGLAVQC